MEPQVDTGHAEELGASSALAQGWWRVDGWLSWFDSVLVVTALLGSASFAFASAAARWFDIAASPWLDLLPRYLTLTLGWFGASLAARRGSHIALDLAQKFLPARAARAARFVAQAVAAVVASGLTWASVRFVIVEREGGALLLQSLPTWVPASVLVLGFGLMTVRFWMRAVIVWLPALAVVPAVMVGSYYVLQHAPERVLLFGALLIGGGAVAGTPLFVVLGGAALMFFVYDDVDIAAVPIEVYRITEPATLVTLPLFTLMGAVLSAGNAPRRLVRVGKAFFGFIPGGLLIQAVVVCAFFTTFTGASGVTILALGLLLHTMLQDEGYDEGLSIGLITASGSIGLLFAPALPLIIYAIIAKVDIDKMFLAGVLPGILLISAVAGMALWRARGGLAARQKFEAKEALAGLKEAAWDLFLPVLVLGLLLLGFATVVEAAAIGCLYSIFVALVVHRDISLRALLPTARDSAVLIGGVLVILGVALAFTGYLVDAEIPQLVVEWASERLAGKYTFLLATNILLLVVGCLLDIFSATIIFVPLLVPVAEAFGVDPIHLGIIFLANLEIGYLTPPVGMNLFLSSYRFNKPLPFLWRTAWPFLLILLVALLVITYVPALSLFLVEMF